MKLLLPLREVAISLCLSPEILQWCLGSIHLKAGIETQALVLSGRYSAAQRSIDCILSCMINSRLTSILPLILLFKYIIII